jgi:ATP-dependent helicase/nuclease subunit A
MPPDPVCRSTRASCRTSVSAVLTETSKPLLEFVDRAIAAIGPESFGLDNAPEPHVGDARPGLVTLWHPVNGAARRRGRREGPETWLSEPERRMADRIAEQVRALVGQFRW